MSQLDNSLPHLTYIASLEVTNMFDRSCYNWHLVLPHQKLRGHIRIQMLKFETDEYKAFTITNLI